MVTMESDCKESRDVLSSMLMIQNLEEIKKAL